MGVDIGKNSTESSIKRQELFLGSTIAMCQIVNRDINVKMNLCVEHFFNTWISSLSETFF